MVQSIKSLEQEILQPWFKFKKSIYKDDLRHCDRFHHFPFSGKKLLIYFLHNPVSRKLPEQQMVIVNRNQC